MAIDLATSLSPYEFQNMLPLDVLAAVASETLKNEIHPSDNVETKMENGVKRHIKKSTTSVLTFEDVKRMPAKLLIDKFSEMTSDELTKKYSYKCMLLPQKCNITFKSFGNEKKACDKMKFHLLCHIQQLTKEYEQNEGNSNVIFIPKSPTSNLKHAEKLTRKSLKKHPISFNSRLSTSSFKTSKKLKTSTFSLKSVKKKLIEKNKYFPAMKNGLSKVKGKSINSVYLKENPSVKQHSDESFNLTDNNNFQNKKVKSEIPENSDPEFDGDYYSSSYSRHLKIAFFTDVEVKEDFSESPSESEGEISQTNESDNSGEEGNKSFSSNNSSSDKSFIFLQDHNYINLDSSKSDKLMTPDLKNIPRRLEDPFKYLVTDELPPWVVKTPPFPFIHTPILPEVAEIIEIRMGDSNADIDKYSQSNIGTYYWDAQSSSKSESEDMSTDESASDHEEKYSDGILYKMNCPNSSVLECVENIENKKHSSACVPKSEISASENDENLENLQKDEKELALKYIAKLHSKGKKKFTDSLICQICPDKHFTAQATLIHHYRSHAGIKPYICKLCSAKFTRQHSLNYHMLIHQNLSRFTCDYCARTFRHPSHYKEHLRRHTGETPYHCTDCNLHFKTRNTFKRHLKTRHAKLLTATGIEDLNPE